MRYKIIWSECAVNNLREIHNFISIDSVIQADKVIGEILSCVEPLSDFPNMGVVVKEFPQYKFRELIKYSYRIIYQISENIYQVYHVFRYIAIRGGNKKAYPKFIFSQDTLLKSFNN